MDNDVLVDKINGIDGRLTKLESTRPYLEELIKRNSELTEKSIESNDKLSEALNDIKITMTVMNDKIDSQGEKLEQMRNEFESASKQTDDKIHEIEEKADTFENKTKFDMLAWLKENFPWIIVFVGLGAAIASQYIKF